MVFEAGSVQVQCRFDVDVDAGSMFEAGSRLPPLLDGKKADHRDFNQTKS